MSKNLIQILLDLLGGDKLEGLSSQLGESMESLQSGVQSMIPTILGGFMGKLDGDNAIFDLIKKFGADGNMDFGGILNSIFSSEQLEGILNTVKEFCGLKEESVISLLSTVTPAVTTSIQEKINADGLNAQGLASLLESQKESISAAMPEGFADKLASNLGDDSGVSFGKLGLGALGVGGLTSGASKLLAGAKEATAGAVDKAGDLATDAVDTVKDNTSKAGAAIAGAGAAVSDAASKFQSAASEAASNVADKVEDIVRPTEVTKRAAAAPGGGNSSDGGSKLPALLLLGALGLGGFWLFKSYKDADVVGKVTDSVTGTLDKAGDTLKRGAEAVDAVTGSGDDYKAKLVELGEFGVLALPDGTEINVPANGVEHSILEDLTDAGDAAIDGGMTYELDRAWFEGSEIKDEKQMNGQIGAVSSMLKAFPGVSAKVTGFFNEDTDEARLEADKRVQRAAHAFKQNGVGVATEVALSQKGTAALGMNFMRDEIIAVPEGGVVSQEGAETGVAPEAADETQEASSEETPATVEAELPSGEKLSFTADGFDAHMLDFIQNGDLAANPNHWLSFDGVNFETGSANLTKDSSAQLDRIVKILKAYPAVELKVGGYTDNTGNADFNVKLSGKRAAAVVNYLVSNGINAARLASEGYGSAHPVASNDTEDGRAQNRRVATKVTKK